MNFQDHREWWKGNTDEQFICPLSPGLHFFYLLQGRVHCKAFNSGDLSQSNLWRGLFVCLNYISGGSAQKMLNGS